MTESPERTQPTLAADEAKWTAQDWEWWAYRLGLTLDRLVPLYGRTNRQRIEEAVRLALLASPAKGPSDWPKDAELTPEEVPLFDVIWDAISEASDTGDFSRPAHKAARRILALLAGEVAE